jgi:O-antigen ligase
MVLGLVVLFACLHKRGRNSGPILWGILAVIVGFVAFGLSSSLIDRLLVSNEEQLRFLVFPSLFSLLSERPFLGQGIGAFQDVFRTHVPLRAAQAEWTMAHNSYLENIYELGVIGAGLLYSALMLVLVRLVRGLRVRSTDEGLQAMALACMVAAGFHSMFDFSLQMPAVAALFAALIGIGWSQSFTRKDRAAIQAAEAKNDI